jgi:two-component system cell cycle sensor histidine kinase/response regulator CckA
MEAVGRLAGGVAHDFNNLLTVIKVYTELTLAALDRGDRLRANLSEVQGAADRASSLTQQLLAFSRRQAIQPRVLDLNDLLRNIEKMLHRLIGEDIELSTILEPELGCIEADPGQMEQVIMNLAVNARDAMPQGGRLCFETANVVLDDTDILKERDLSPGSYVRLRASDTGVGMDEKVLSHAFEPFFTTKEAGKGTGLGLATVHGIVKQNRGDIRLYSQPGQGTTFEILLPRARDAGQDIQEQLPETLTRGTETILLVEDDSAVRGLTRQVLRQQGYRVLAARDAAEALQLAGEWKDPVELLITDVVLPGMRGPDLAAQVLATHRNCRVLYVSGHANDAIAPRGVLAADIAFLQKPFTLQSLTAKVREVLSAPPKE